MSHHPEDHLETILDALKAQKDSSREEIMRWGDVQIGVTGSDLSFNGVPLHPFVQWRLSSYLIGLRKAKWGWWLENPDLLAEALKRGGEYGPEDEVRIRVVNDQVVFATRLHVQLGHHYDYMEAMVSRFLTSHRLGKTPVSLLGYMVDPVWTHVKLLWLPQSERTHQMGIQFDTNFMFSNMLRGRAYASLLAYDLYWESSINLDTWWSVRAQSVKRSLNLEDVMFPPFERQTEKRMKHIRSHAATSLMKLATLKKRKPRKEWRQAMLTDFSHRFAGRSKFRAAAVRYEESGRESLLDFAFALSWACRDVTLDRRLDAERRIAVKLQEVKGR